MRRYIPVALILFLIANTALAQGWSDVQRVFGRSGKVQDQVLSMEYPRSDVDLRVGAGSALDPNVASTTMFHFQRMSGRAVLMTSEFVLLEQEIEPALTYLASRGISIAALHNHLDRETPRLFYLHADAQGDGTVIARDLLNALRRTGTPLHPRAPEKSRTDWRDVERILGQHGEAEGEVVMFQIPIARRISMHGTRMKPELDPAHDINMQNLPNGQVASAGEIACTTAQVTPVILTLRKGGIRVTAAHNHFTTESPRIMYVHFYQVGRRADIARVLRRVLDQVGVRPGG